MEAVKTLDWNPKWDGGAPMPRVFSNGAKIYLIYTVADWDRKFIQTVNRIETTKGNSELLALVEFDGSTFKFGIANDEVFPGLPQYVNGLNEWAHVIEQSGWIEEIMSIHKIHPHFDPARWKDLNHYILLFKDEIMEVIARSYKIELFETSYYDMSLEVIKRMNNI